MMPVIRISDPVFERLQTIAIPLVDTPGSVVERLLDFYQAHKNGSPAVSHLSQPESKSSEDISALDPTTDLKHTRVLTARFDGQPAKN